MPTESAKKSEPGSLYFADPSLSASDLNATGVPSGSALLDAANRFATQVMVKLAEEFPGILDEFLQQLAVACNDDQASVVSVRADKEVSGASLATDPLWSDIESLFADGSSEPVIVADTHQENAHPDAEWCRQMQQSGIRAALFYPLIGRGDLRGVLILTRRDRPGDWSSDFVSELADVAAVIGSVLAHRRIEGLLEGALRGNRRLSQQLVEIQEQEQRRLAQELHDETGQYLAALMSDATLIGRRIPQGDDILRRSAEAVVTTAEHIYEVVYGVMGRLCAVDIDVCHQFWPRK